MGLTPRLWTPAEYRENLLAPVGRVVLGMERAGVPVDPDVLRQIDADMAKRADDFRAQLLDWTRGVEVNWNSWQQIAKWFHDPPESGGLGMEPSPYWKKGEVDLDAGEVKTDDRALEWLAGHNPEHRENIQALRQLRTSERMGRYARDWLDKMVPHEDGTWRLHPSFGLATDHDTRPGAVTGRFGVKNPPLNQVPRHTSAAGDLGIPKDPAGMRRAFVPPPGHRLVVVDYSQLEVVIQAHLIAKLFGPDDPLVRMVREGRDIHAPLARTVFGELAGDPVVAAAADGTDDTRLNAKGKPLNEFKEVPLLKLYRDLAKAGVYGDAYGKGEHGFATSTFLPTGEPLGEERAHLLVQGIAKQFPGKVAYKEYIREWIQREGYIMSLLGRWQPQPLANHRQMGLRNRAWRQSLNYPMQAGGQEIMALALVAIALNEHLRSLGFVLSLVVHDEVVGWAPEDKADECLSIVQQIMVEVVELLAPLKAEGHTGRNWSEAK